MLKDFFKILFGSKKKLEVIPVITPKDNIVEEEAIPEPKKVKTKKKKSQESYTIEVALPKQEIPMAGIYLVTIDTTGKPQTLTKGMIQSIQNFYFVFANDEGHAKYLTLYTFRQNPVMQQVMENCMKVTALNDILSGMNAQRNFWSYIPFSGQRRPGQQAIIPDPSKLLGKDEFGNETAKNISASHPTDVGQVKVDLTNVTLDAQDGSILRKLGNKPVGRTQELEEETQEGSTDLQAQLMQMQKQMQQLMTLAANKQPAKPKRQVKPKQSIKDLEKQIELEIGNNTAPDGAYIGPQHVPQQLNEDIPDAELDKLIEQQLASGKIPNNL